VGSRTVDDNETFVLRPTAGHRIFLFAGLIFCACLFTGIAAFAVWISAFAAQIQIDSLAARLALWLVALVLLLLACYMLLLLRATIVRIEVGPRWVSLRLPHVRGPLPVLGTIRAEVPYSAIVAVETRQEVYTSFGTATIQHAYSIVIHGGIRLPLGVMADNRGMQLKFDKAAALIASRAGTAIVDRGAVRVGGVIHAMLHDVPPWEAPAMTPAEYTVWRRRAALTIQFLMFLLGLTAMLRACGKSS
jgi:hypothetical protein